MAEWKYAAQLASPTKYDHLHVSTLGSGPGRRASKHQNRPAESFLYGFARMLTLESASSMLFVLTRNVDFTAVLFVIFDSAWSQRWFPLTLFLY